MKEINYWKNFTETGKVEDYLSYRKQEYRKEKTGRGEDSDAGHSKRYRTDTEDGTFRGI